jgi:hypothetical protein
MGVMCLAASLPCPLIIQAGENRILVSDERKKKPSHTDYTFCVPKVTDYFQKVSIPRLPSWKLDCGRGVGLPRCSAPYFHPSSLYPSLPPSP